MRTCTKQQYPSQCEAAYVLFTIRRRAERGEFIDPCSATRAYLCPDHDHDVWHLTKQPLNRRRIDTDVIEGEY